MENKIMKLRKERGLSIRKLSKLTGLAADTISKYEREERNPKIENWKKLADFFEVSIEYLQGKTLINERPDKDEIGMENNIMKLRKERGLSIRQLSKLTGISAPTLSRYENGDRHPKIENWQKLADYFGVSVEYLQGKTFINKRPDKEKTMMNDLVKVNFQFINPDVNTTTYIKKSDCLGLTFIKDRFIEDYDENGKLYGVVNLGQVAHVTFLDKCLKEKR